MTPTHRIVLSSLLVVIAGPARADAPCAADAKRFCERKSALELVSCLQAHRPDLAPACVQRLEKALVFLQNVKYDCEADAFEFCRGTAPGYQTVDCIAKNQGKLTRRCQQFFDTVRARDEALQKVCSTEAARACPGVPSGRGELWICLELAGDDLSPECKAAL